ncbi:SARP family transcriptional regulator [Arthrobacter sp. ISL-65]|uniref:AfsR/SARP family transcriptional regulator n=1 Tax=Arthrobacter sp. ISL-65 TaxID=2819112 RepID=UPI001BE6079D|nr:SARP family transcriptional regulator [Arthrobacter sp. ISL-65]MBT2550972.1 SARP family transcriptional regulator [Arthrobacter sp. ISL-65]
MAEAWIRLLGIPEILRSEGTQVQPRGRKSWALLAYLLLGRRKATRSSLASLLFADAEDPLGALRWNLSQLRRALGPEIELAGDPLTVVLPENWHCDVESILGPRATGLIDSSAIEGELLEGLSFPECSAFDAWLIVERHRIANAVQTVIYEEAVAALAAGAPQAAASLATKVAGLDPFNANFQSVLIKSLIAAGDQAGARKHVLQCADDFRRELGVELPEEIRRALVPEKRSTGPLVPASAVTVHSYLEAASASRAAGAVDRAMDQLRTAGELAERTGRNDLRAETLIALAGGLIHSVGARGAAVDALLHKSLTLLPKDEASPLTAAAYCDLGWLSSLRGTPESAIRWLDRAERCSEGLPKEQAKILTARGMTELNTARYGPGHGALDASVELAVMTGDRRQEAIAMAMNGHGYLLQGNLGRAAAVLDKALAVVSSEHWTAFAPFVEALRGAAYLAEGKLDEATDYIDHATVLASLTGNNAFMIVSADAQARLHLALGESRIAQQHIHQVQGLSPGWVWAGGRLMDTACEVALATQSPEASVRASRLTELASRSGMRELVVRAHSHRGVLGDAEAAEAVPFLARGIDNPALESYLAARKQLTGWQGDD